MQGIDMLQIVFLFVILSVVSSNRMEGFIVGGKEVSIRRWPFIAFISVSSGKDRISACGGSLLSSQSVLTAAHCLDDITQNKKLLHSGAVTFTIYMGHSAYDKSKMARRMWDYETYEKYDPDRDDVKGDIGVMFLYSPVKFIKNVKKVILFNKRFDPRRDSKLLVAGWGRFDTGEEVRISPRLKAANLRSISLNECKNKHPFIEDISTVVCAAASKEFAYSGDSGGPMVKRRGREQLGIVSFRNEETGVTVFTSVPEYYEWINETNYKLFQKYCG